MSQKLQIVYRRIEELKVDPRNARVHTPEQMAQLRASYLRFGFTNPILLRPDDVIGAGHGRLLMAKDVNLTEVPTITLELSEEKWRAYAIADNQLALRAEWNEQLLLEELNALDKLEFDLIGELGFAKDELADLGVLGFGAPEDAPRASLADAFGVPPFSVLSARDGWWQARKRAWLALGIRSEIGRGDSLK